MYPRFAFALLFSVCAFGLGIAIPAFPVQKCGQNAEFMTCGSACVSDCSHPAPYEICTYQCVVGCFCKEGFLKNANGECVRPQECDAQTHHDIPMQLPSHGQFPQCPDNEEFQTCGSACAPDCKNPHPSPVCTKNCVIACFCKQGHLRNSRGLCVPAHQCEAAPETSAFFAYPPEVSQCKENEVFMPCGSACAPTCANPHPGPACTLQCVVGCFCKPGYLKNEHGVCVPSTTCGVPAAEAMALPPKMCGDNEEYRQCKGCDGTCDKPNPICPRICIPGCACKQGHLRTGSNGRCIMAQQCPQVDPMPPTSFIALNPTETCGDNEEFRQCKGCDGTCDNPNPLCPRICKPGCACKSGTFRNSANGRCVIAQECPPMPLMMLPPVQQCGENEEFHACGTACPATCANPHPSPVCTKNCVIGCFCKPGHLKNEHGVCVAAANCGAKSGPINIPLFAAPAQHEGQCASDREVFSPCGEQLDCLASCNTPLPFLIHGEPQIPRKCLERKCTPGCICQKPYLRHTDGRCVEVHECQHNNPFTTPSH